MLSLSLEEPSSFQRPAKKLKLAESTAFGQEHPESDLELKLGPPLRNPEAPPDPGPLLRNPPSPSRNRVPVPTRPRTRLPTRPRNPRPSPRSPEARLNPGPLTDPASLTRNPLATPTLPRTRLQTHLENLMNPVHTPKRPRTQLQTRPRTQIHGFTQDWLTNSNKHTDELRGPMVTSPEWLKHSSYHGLHVQTVRIKTGLPPDEPNELRKSSLYHMLIPNPHTSEGVRNLHTGERSYYRRITDAVSSAEKFGHYYTQTPRQSTSVAKSTIEHKGKYFGYRPARWEEMTTTGKTRFSSRLHLRKRALRRDLG